MNPNLNAVLAHLQELKGDSDVSRRFKEKTEKVITILTQNSELAVEKALLELEELSTLEASSYLRTQVWDVIGMLESINH